HAGDACVGDHAGVRSRPGGRGQLHHARSAVHHHQGTRDHRLRPPGLGGDMLERPLPTEQEVRAYIRDRRNWGRWGRDDQVGALNLVTPAKRAAAARLVTSGRAVSLSRPFPKEPGPKNAFPAQHYMRTLARGDAGCVSSGREAWQSSNPDKPYSRPFAAGPLERPGLHVSCLPFLRDHDVSVLVWDMLDHLPMGYDIPWAVHAALFAYGVALL